MLSRSFTHLDLVTPGGVVNLYDSESGFCPQELNRGIPNLKGGGVWRDSSLTAGRRLVLGVYENAIDTYTYLLASIDPTEVIYRLGQIVAGAISTVNYWTGFDMGTPPYLRGRVRGQTALAYSPIYKITIPALGSGPYAAAFTQIDLTALNQFEVIIERGEWSDNIPGERTGVAVGTRHFYEDNYYGNINADDEFTPSTDGEAYLANRYTAFNLTHIFVDDGGVFGSNLIDFPSAALLPASPVLNDAIYFVAENSGSNWRPAVSAVFNLDVARVGGGGTWEYYNGSWVALSGAVADETSGFTVLGVNGVFVNAPADWTNLTVNGVNGLAFRWRVTSAITTPPENDDRRIYAANWNFTEIQAGEVPGELPALMRIEIVNKSYNAAGSPTLSAHRVMAGIRSSSRGDDFRSWWPVGALGVVAGADPVGITYEFAVGTAPNYAGSPGGQRRITTPAAQDTYYGGGAWDMASSVYNQYAGSYRVFLICEGASGNAEDLEVRLQVRALGAPLMDKTRFIYRPGTDYEALDFGLLTLPGGNTITDYDTVAASFSVSVRSSLASAWPAFRLHGIALIPVDEGVFDSSAPLDTTATTNLIQSNPLTVDSARQGKATPIALIRGSTLYDLIMPKKFGIPPEGASRLHCLIFKQYGTAPVTAGGDITYHANPQTVFRITALERYSRWLGIPNI